MQYGGQCGAPGLAADYLAFLWRLRRDSFFPSIFVGRGSGHSSFSDAAYPNGTHTWSFYFILSLISGQRQLPAGSAEDAFPAASRVPRGVRRAPGGRGCSRRRARGPTRRGSRGTSTGPQLPLAASRCPPQGPLGCPFPPLPRALPAPAPTWFHRKNRRQKPNAAAVPSRREVVPGCGGGTREGSATRAVPRLNLGGVNGIVAPVKLRGLPNFFQ